MIDGFQVEPYFAFAWFITWFAHHVGGLDDASRLFDVFLCSHPLFSLYVSGAVREDTFSAVLVITFTVACSRLCLLRAQ